MEENKKTKIVATLGPASNDKVIIRELLEAGVNVFRLNFSHGNHNEHGERIKILKELLDEGYIFGIMGDTKGPEIRTRNFIDGRALIEKDSEVIVGFKDELCDKSSIYVTYDFFDEVTINNHIKIDDGQLDLLVLRKDTVNHTLLTRALNSHEVSNYKGVNLPYINIKLPFISSKDEEDIAFMVRNKLDYIATSFTRNQADIYAIRELLRKYSGDNIKIIAKIENQQGVNNIEEIVKASDGVMVARGDLGVEVPVEDVPFIQKEIINICSTTGKPVIIATQMLDSMQKNPVPTRAEVSDVANAIFDNGDAIMLSGETASGDYPLEAVKMQSRIALRIEQCIDYQALTKRSKETNIPSLNNALASAVAELTEVLDVKLIIAMTSSGSTPRRIAKFRPRSKIIAVVEDLAVARGLCGSWGVYPFFVEDASLGLEDAVILAREIAKKKNIEKGSHVIVTGGTFKGNTDYLKVITI